MKIICVGYLHGSGGAERQIILLANALADRGHQVVLAVLGEYNRKYEISNKVKVADLSIVEENDGIVIVNRYMALKRLYKVEHPDISIHYWLQSAYLTAAMPKKITGKIVYSERGDPSDSEYDGLLGFVRRLSFSKIDGFVFQSEGARDFFTKKIVEKATVIHNSIAVPYDKYLSPSKIRDNRIVSVGRLHPQKNQTLLINAFKELLKKWPNYTLEIYGEGKLMNKLENEINRLGLSKNVFLMGTRKDILDSIYSAKAFVLTSDYEGMPNALMEAMAIGLPCVSTDCRPGGARTLIENGINGFIVERNNISQLVDRLDLVLSNKEIEEMIAQNAISIRYNHTPRYIFDCWNDYLQRVEMQ